MRLSNDKRNSILKQEVRNKFHDILSKNEKSIMDECQKIAEKKIPKWITGEMIKSGYIKTNSSFCIEGEDTSLLYDLDIYNGSNLYNPVPHHNHYGKIQIEKSKTLINLIKKRRDLLKSEKEFRFELRQVLFSYSTVKKLLDAIPEFKDYFDDIVSSTALVPIDQINKVRKSLAKVKPSEKRNA